MYDGAATVPTFSTVPSRIYIHVAEESPACCPVDRRPKSELTFSLRAAAKVTPNLKWKGEGGTLKNDSVKYWRSKDAASDFFVQLRLELITA